MHGIHHKESNTRFHFNSDMSGDVIVQNNYGEFRVSGFAIMDLAAHIVRRVKISAIEDASDEEILYGSPNLFP